MSFVARKCVNVGNVIQNFGGKKLGLYPPDQQANYIDLPFLPSFDEAKSFFKSPTQGAAFSGAENMLSLGKQNEIKTGLLQQGIYPGSPEWKNSYHNAVYHAKSKGAVYELEHDGKPVAQPNVQKRRGEVYEKLIEKLEYYEEENCTE